MDYVLQPEGLKLLDCQVFHIEISKDDVFLQCFQFLKYKSQIIRTSRILLGIFYSTYARWYLVCRKKLKFDGERKLVRKQKDLLDEMCSLSVQKPNSGPLSLTKSAHYLCNDLKFLDELLCWEQVSK